MGHMMQIPDRLVYLFPLGVRATTGPSVFRIKKLRFGKKFLGMMPEFTPEMLATAERILKDYNPLEMLPMTVLPPPIMKEGWRIAALFQQTIGPIVDRRIIIRPIDDIGPEPKPKEDKNVQDEKGDAPQTPTDEVQ